ncbi:MAG: glycosyltransferase family 2 protein [Bdellovibrionota bacterium]
MIFFYLSAGIFYSLGWILFFRGRYLPSSPHQNQVEISIIVPARNEQDNLQKLLPRLNEQESKPAEIIVVDDQSTDQTASIAKKHSATVLQLFEHPKTWLGKTLACQRGAEASKGQWLLFLDADVQPEKDFLTRIAGCDPKPGTVLGIMPFHNICKTYENASLLFQLITVFSTRAFSWPKPSQALGMFGQCMLIHREDYQKIGGHEAVKSQVVENFSLGQKMNQLGIEKQYYLGKGSLSMRMFPTGLADLIRGWSKTFLKGSSLVPTAWMTLISLWISSAMFTFFSLLGTEEPWRTYSMMLYLLFAFQIWWLGRRLGKFSLLGGIFFPLHFCFYNVIFFRSLWKKCTGQKEHWKGRELD